MIIRTIHHAPATGGTLISKCIAALSTVYLLSEINPLGGINRARFSPTELISQFQAQYKITEQVKRRHFINQLGLILELCRQHQKTLVLRDHVPFIFHWMNPLDRRPLLEFLDDYKTLSMVSIRDPIDSFLGSLKRGWLKHIGDDFETYCARHLLFMERYGDFEYIKYEDFCARPTETMKNLCEILALPYEPEFIDKFGAIALTGDSGRTRTEIVVHPRRELPEEIAAQVELSKSYKIFCERFGY